MYGLCYRAVGYQMLRNYSLHFIFFAERGLLQHLKAPR